MTKVENQILKGVSILFMLWLHCFNTGIDIVPDYNDIYILGGGLCDYIARLTGPVELYILLSGYGLYLTYKKNKIDPIKRVFKLMMLYWITLIIFVTLGYFIDPQNYPGSTIKIIGNITSWRTSYNATIWFLFPYICTVFNSKLYLAFLDKRPYASLIIAFLSYILFYGLSWAYSMSYVQIPYLGQIIIEIGKFVFPFVVGASLCKYNVVQKSKLLFANKQILLSIITIVLFFFRTLTTFHFCVHLFFSIFIILMVCSFRRPLWLDKFLVCFGKKSTSIWFIHAYLIWYLFKNYYYSLEHPILIYTTLIATTFIFSIPIDWIYNTTLNLIFRRIIDSNHSASNK